jgi:hypothetical protein
MIVAMFLVWAITGCTAMAPKPEQLQLPTQAPAVRETSFSETLSQLGILSEIYGLDLLKIQCRDLDDVTGTSYHTGGEIPKSITVMVKSALNAIGGKVVYIPFWPNYFAGIQVSGYPVSDQKLVPDVILAGGITEFDRGLTTLDRSRNLDVESGELRDASSLVKGRTIGLDYSQGDKWNKAKISVDFNLVSYEALCGIPKMQASNGITVYKGIKEEELGFTLFGPTIGLRGSVKKVQGRHDAVRLLVQFSVIQLVGRYMDLPYWQLLDGVQPDPVVIQSLKAQYKQNSPVGRTLMLKRLLWIHGHPVSINGQMDDQTKDALTKMDPGYENRSDNVPVATFLKLHLDVPVNGRSIERANRFDRLLARHQALEEKKALEKSQKKKPPVRQKKQTIQKKKQHFQQEKSKTVKPKQPAPKHEIIIITPLDAQTHHILSRFVRRIEDKRDNRSSAGGFQDDRLLQKSALAPPSP